MTMFPPRPDEASSWLNERESQELLDDEWIDDEPDPDRLRDVWMDRFDD